MEAILTPSIEQIKHYSESALSAFETLDLETAAEVAQKDLRRLLEYLEAFNFTENVITISLCGKVNPTIKLEEFIGERNRRD